MDPSLADKYDALQQILVKCGKVAVAYSGGVDSTLLLKVAADTLPGQVVGLMAATPLHPEAEKVAATANGAAISCSLHVLPIDPLTWPQFVANPPDRCYHCKKHIYSHFLEECARKGATFLMDGTNLDDLKENRPGHRALRELKISTPLVEAGFDKVAIRRLSRELKLATWNKPSSSCLATRLAPGMAVTLERLQTVAQGETFLHGLGFVACRLRLETDEAARLELAPGGFTAISRKSTRSTISHFFNTIGITKLSLDLYERKGIVA